MVSLFKKINGFPTEDNQDGYYCMFVAKRKGVKELFSERTPPCFAQLNGRIGPVTTLRIKHLSPWIANKQYIQWLLNDSIYAKCFKGKNAEYAIKYGVELHTKYSRSEVVGAAIAYRFATEYHQQVTNIWKPMVDAGVNGNLALAMAAQCEAEGKGDITYYGERGHSPCGNFTEEGLKLFTLGVVPNPPKDKMNEGSANYAINVTYCQTKPRRLYNAISGMFALNRDGWGYKEQPFKDFVKKLLAYQEEISK